MSRRRIVIVLLLIVFGRATAASADLTAFVGAQVNEDRQAFRGAAVGGGFLIVGFEFEYAHAGEDESSGLSSLTSGSGNVLLQTPIPIAGTQFYATTGVGVYRENLDRLDFQETNVAFNTGGGAKVTLIGPLRVRLDYRVVKLHGEPLRPSVIHRIYAGINIAF
jgi:hypothetical protein